MNLKNDATLQEIEIAYVRYFGERYRIKNFYEIYDAYSVLSDPGSKISYDIALKMWLFENEDVEAVPVEYNENRPIEIVAPVQPQQTTKSHPVYSLYVILFWASVFCASCIPIQASGTNTMFLRWMADTAISTKMRPRNLQVF